MDTVSWLKAYYKGEIMPNKRSNEKAIENRLNSLGNIKKPVKNNVALGGELKRTVILLPEEYLYAFKQHISEWRGDVRIAEDNNCSYEE